MNRSRVFCGVFACMLACSVSADISDNELPKFKTSGAKHAADSYKHAADRAREDYKEKLAMARKALAEQLEVAQGVATKSGNLDEAILIRETLAQLKTSADDDSVTNTKGVLLDRSKLAGRLSGSSWKSGGKTLDFGADGSGSFSAGGGSFPFGWTPIDGRRIYIMLKEGWTIRLDFNENLTSFTYQEFGGGTRKDDLAGTLLPVKPRK